MKITPFKPIHYENLRNFISKCSYLPFMEYKVDIGTITSHVLDEISNIHTNKGLILVGEESNSIVGLIALERLPWDSKLYSTEMAKISFLLATGDYFQSLYTKRQLVSHLLSECTKQLILHVSTRINKEDLSGIHALENCSFHLMDVLVTYSLDFKTILVENTPLHAIRRFVVSDLSSLIEISAESFGKNSVATDRFHADPVLNKQKSNELYTNWLINSIKDPTADLMIAEQDGIPIGYCLCNVNEKINEKLGLRLASVALIAVKASHRNKRVAESLIRASVESLRSRVDVLEAGGQISNYSGQRSWTRVGFKINRSKITFHWSVLPDNIQISAKTG